MRSHGWLRDNESHFREKHLSQHDISDFESNYFFMYPGMNVRSTDLNAYVGRNQLKKMDRYVGARDANYRTYCELLEGTHWIQKSNTNLVSSLGFGLISKNREKLVKNLVDDGIECRPLICGSIQEHPFWLSQYDKVDLPNATLVHQEGLYVPCHQNMTENEVGLVCQILLKSVT